MVLSMTFLLPHIGDKDSKSEQKYPITLAIIYQDAKENRHVRVYTVNIDLTKLDPTPLLTQAVSPSAHSLIPLKDMTFIVVSEDSLVLIQTNILSEIKIPRTIIGSFSRITQCSFLCSDSMGGIFMLSLLNDQMTLLKMDAKTGIASSLNWLSDDYFYLGSHYSDSQVLKLIRNDSEILTVDVIESFTNLAPIIDFCVVDVEQQGQVIKIKLNSY